MTYLLLCIATRQLCGFLKLSDNAPRLFSRGSRGRLKGTCKSRLEECDIVVIDERKGMCLFSVCLSLLKDMEEVQM